MTSIDLPVHRLARYCNPLKVLVWDSLVTKSDVEIALKTRRLVHSPGSDDHAGRIAYLVENEAPDAIEIDVGAPALNCHVEWFVQDGNHRLAAAIFAERETIKASVGGQLDYAERLFGTPC